MSQLYDMKLRVEEKIKTDGLNTTEVKGKLGLKCGKLLAFITPDTPDDPAVIDKLRRGAKEILNLGL